MCTRNWKRLESSEEDEDQDEEDTEEEMETLLDNNDHHEVSEDVEEDDDDLEEEDFPILEKLFDTLILCLRDPETSVRWTTAKGIGRITERHYSNGSSAVLFLLLQGSTEYGSFNYLRSGVDFVFY